LDIYSKKITAIYPDKQRQAGLSLDKWHIENRGFPEETSRNVLNIK